MQPLLIGDTEIRPGQNVSVNIPLPSLYTQAKVAMPVHVVQGRRSGPRLFVCAAIHGDEINGVEIIRRVVQSRTLRHLQGTLLAIPVVNVYGFVRQQRYLPDRRDLNRCFPGSETGSLAARLAFTFLREVVEKCTHGIDLHTGAIHRDNLPQIRATLDQDEQTESLARAFGAPVILGSDLRDGSLRAEAAARSIPLLVFEAGEALRFDELVIRAGVRGILRVMYTLGMIKRGRPRPREPEPVVARSSSWVRAPQSGVLRMLTPLGARVKKGGLLGVVSDAFRYDEEPILAPASGVVIGRTNLPLVTEGEALFHIARFGEPDSAAETVEQFQYDLNPETDERPPEEPPIV